jgi:hypothetical protein
LGIGVVSSSWRRTCTEDPSAKEVKSDDIIIEKIGSEAINIFPIVSSSDYLTLSPLGAVGGVLSPLAPPFTLKTWMIGRQLPSTHFCAT